MKKTLAGAAICAALILGSSGAAFAGEVNGNGEGTQGPDHANSLCVFSGLEDDFEGQGVVPGHAQNWGQIPKEFRDIVSVHGAAQVDFFGDEEGCNAHLYGMK